MGDLYRHRLVVRGSGIFSRFLRCVVQRFGLSGVLAHSFVVSCSAGEEQPFRHLCGECYLEGVVLPVCTQGHVAFVIKPSKKKTGACEHQAATLGGRTVPGAARISSEKELLKSTNKDVI